MKYKKKNSKIPYKGEEIIHFLSMHKVGMRLICIHVAVLNMGIPNQNVIIYIMFSSFLYLFKELHKQASELSSRLE